MRLGDGEPELISNVHRYLRAGAVGAWAWSLSSRAGPIVGFAKPGFTTSGLCDTQREARDALVVAWRHEEAFRADIRARARFVIA